MKDDGTACTRMASLKGYIVTLLALWTFFCGAVLAWNLLRHRAGTREAAVVQARASFEKDLVYRQWASVHGGVYVPLTEETPPNPYLSHVEERDISTTSGKRLTLMNPAYMTRQVHELGGERFGLMGNITSLNPIRAENAADEWERKALEAFEDGAEEVKSLEWVGGAEYMRLMRPLYTESDCLKCHSEQGYELGDVRGGICVSVPMAPLRAISRAHGFLLTAGHAVLWLLGAGGVWVGGWLLVRRVCERDHAQRELEEHRAKLEEVVRERTGEVMEVNERLVREIEDRNRLENEILSISEREQRRIGQELHDSLGQQLTGVAIMSKVMEQKLWLECSDEADSAAKITQLINEAIDQTRSLSRGLHPVDVEAGGLVSAMRDLSVSTGELFDISCQFECADDVDINDGVKATHLYRIAQEAITNAIKHGGAKNVTISLSRSGDDYEFKICADGRDFPDDIPSGKGMGLRIMAYRAEMCGGKLNVGAGESGGSVVSCLFGND